jgi:RimJ/RimL family protein N-acetyltransferase
MERTSLREPCLETARLILRPIRLEDFAGWATVMADEESARYIGGRQSRPIAWRGFLSMAGAWRVQGFGMFSVLEKATRRWIGRVGPWRPQGWPGNEIGWNLRRDCWGHGYATEAAEATIDWAFEHLGWKDIIHCIAPANLASQRVATKLGSLNRGRVQLPEPYRDAVVDEWGQTRAEWYESRRCAASRGCAR